MAISAGSVGGDRFEQFAILAGDLEAVEAARAVHHGEAGGVAGTRCGDRCRR